jgi:hypothetical protein
MKEVKGITIGQVFSNLQSQVSKALSHWFVRVLGVMVSYVLVYIAGVVGDNWDLSYRVDALEIRVEALEELPEMVEQLLENDKIMDGKLDLIITFRK